ncbi:hypothetical protein BV494_01840 [Rahnella sikkimica]|uniref:Uncharacterized protein n=1 Tax=Rahnella sikkimica TaxID=1805933 RepID=A0A2L1ULD9_9GAMM|nr:hypothetical protein BV494_01840 [Rahnella sikkimica]
MAFRAETEQRGKCFSSLRAAARWLCSSCRSYCRKIPPLRGSLHSGYKPREKNTRFSTSRYGVIFESGWELFQI